MKKRNNSIILKFTLVIIVVLILVICFSSTSVYAYTTLDKLSLTTNNTSVYAGKEISIIGAFKCNNGGEGLTSLSGTMIYKKDIFEYFKVEPVYNSFSGNLVSVEGDTFSATLNEDAPKNEAEFIKFTFKVKDDFTTKDFRTTITMNITRIQSSENVQHNMNVRTANIVLTVNGTEINFNDYNVVEDKYITDIEVDTAVGDFKDNIGTDKPINIYDKNNEEVSDEDPVGTDMTVNIGDEEEFTTVVPGDLNGDGKMTILDVSLLKLHLVGLSKLVDEYNLASDVNGNGSITTTDLSQLKAKLVGIV